MSEGQRKDSQLSAFLVNVLPKGGQGPMVGCWPKEQTVNSFDSSELLQNGTYREARLSQAQGL